MTNKLNVNTIEPEGATTTLNVGRTGRNVIITDNLKANTLKDAGGNTLFTSDGSGNLSSVNSGFGSAMVLLSTQTASTSASLSFTSNIDSTYKEYVFEWIDIHPGTADANWEFQVNAVGETGYNEILNSTFCRAYNSEGGVSGIGYVASDDQSEGTAFQRLIEGGGMPTDNDVSSVGELHIFNPATTTYVKNFYASGKQIKSSGGQIYSIESFAAGYFNITAAIDDVQFKFSSGNIDAGKIKMYGVK